MATPAKKLILGCDHAAYELKQKLKTYLQEQGFELTDVGTHSEDSMDYPDVGVDVAKRIASGEFERGLLMCGTGLGMSMTANRFAGVRAALCNDLFSANMSRRHNNANLLVIGARVVGDILAEEILRTWLEAPYEGGRHQRRVDKFNQLGTRTPKK